MNMNDEEILENYSFLRNLKPVTTEQYKYTFRLYSKFNKMPIKELLTEAEAEDEARIRWKHTRLKARLLRFRAFLYQNYMEGTAKDHMTRITAVYKHYDIFVGDLPPITDRNVRKSKPIRYEDLPTKEEIKQAVGLSDNLMSAIILFMTSSGCARTETLSLTVESFIEATKDYHSDNDIQEILAELGSRNDVIPTWKVHRQKTNTDYYTFSSSESTKAITDYLICENRELTFDSQLFKINTRYLSKKFNDLNKKLGGKKTGTYSHIRSHNLRKWNASQLYNNGMSLSDVDALQGRIKKGARKSYYFEDANILRQKYIEHIEAITIEQGIENLSIKTKEYLQLEQENTELKKEIVSILDRVNKTEDMMKDIYSLIHK